MAVPAERFPIRRRALLRTLPAAGVAAMLGACGGGAALIVPYFIFQFVGVTAVGARRAFASASFGLPDGGDSQARGSFVAEQTFLRISDALNGTVYALGNPVSGTYDETTFRLSVQQGSEGPLAASYAGRFVADDTIQLTPAPAAAGTPVLTLVRVDNSFRPRLFDVDWVGNDANGRPRVLRLQSVIRDDGSPFGQEDATVLFTGTEQVTGLADAAVEGWANMRTAEFTFTRGASSRMLTARMRPPGTTPPADPPSPLSATVIEFDDGTQLERGG